VTRPKKVKLNRANYFGFNLFPCSVPVGFWTRDCSIMGPRKDELAKMPKKLPRFKTQPGRASSGLPSVVKRRGLGSWVHGRTP
jgi:hypothetical protein